MEHLGRPRGPERAGTGKRQGAHAPAEPADASYGEPDVGREAHRDHEVDAAGRYLRPAQEGPPQPAAVGPQDRQGKCLTGGGGQNGPTRAL